MCSPSPAFSSAFFLVLAHQLVPLTFPHFLLSSLFLHLLLLTPNGTHGHNQKHARPPPPTTPALARSYEAPRQYPFPPHRLVLESIPKTCDLFLPGPQLCEEWTRGRSYEYESHNREVLASVLHDCQWRNAVLSREDGSPYGGAGTSTAPCLVVDVGANIGMFSALALSMGAYTVSFEPQDVLVGAFRESIALNHWENRALAHSGYATFESARSGVVRPGVLDSKYKNFGRTEQGTYVLPGGRRPEDVNAHVHAAFTWRRGGSGAPAANQADHHHHRSSARESVDEEQDVPVHDESYAVTK